MNREEWEVIGWPNFSFDEMACHETGENEMQFALMDALQQLRRAMGRPLTVTSGYRSPEHSIEIEKLRPGTHTTGLAVDLGVAYEIAWRVLSLAPALGFHGIGIHQTGPVNKRFIHLDMVEGSDAFVRPTVWSYAK
jgi:zinc D-Ala-D-Ala carboxypeptidase